MNRYRLYKLSPHERVAEAFEREHADDREALARAEAEREQHFAVEVWTGDRLVGRIGGEFNL